MTKDEAIKVIAAITADHQLMVKLPPTLKPSLKEHLERVKMVHQNDVAKGYGRVYLPYALERKYPNASLGWGWQYVFPAKSLSKDSRTGEVRRHHIHENSLQQRLWGHKRWGF